jgi:stage II sporulation protein AA (anti-sigma F factor antagonist)
MNIEVTLVQSCPVLAVEGDLDQETAEQFSEALKKQIESGAKVIILDFSRLELLASVGIGILAQHYNVFKETGGHIKLAGCSKGIQKVMTLIGFNQFFPMFDTVAEALK